jgi:hypothetical protein
VTAALLALALVVGVPCGEAHPLRSGDQAVCDGVLIPGWEAMQALRCLNVALPECEATVTKLDGEAETLTTSHKREVSALNVRIEEADRALAAMAKCPECERAWWDSPAIWGTSGIVVGVGMTLAILRATVMAQ